MPGRKYCRLSNSVDLIFPVTRLHIDKDHVFGYDNMTLLLFFENMELKNTFLSKTRLYDHFRNTFMIGIRWAFTLAKSHSNLLRISNESSFISQLQPFTQRSRMLGNIFLGKKINGFLMK